MDIGFVAVPIVGLAAAISAVLYSSKKTSNPNEVLETAKTIAVNVKKSFAENGRKQAEDTISQAQKQAERIKAEATKKASNNSASASRVLEEAKQRAESIIANAEKKAKNIINENQILGQQHADEVLKQGQEEAQTLLEANTKRAQQVSSKPQNQEQTTQEKPQAQNTQGQTPKEQTTQEKPQAQNTQGQTPKGQTTQEKPQAQNTQGQTTQEKPQAQNTKGQTTQEKPQAQNTQGQNTKGQNTKGQTTQEKPQAQNTQGQTTQEKPQAQNTQGQNTKGQTTQEKPQAQNTQGQNTQAQTNQGQNTQAQNTQGQNTQGQTTQEKPQAQNTQGQTTQGQTTQEKHQAQTPKGQTAQVQPHSQSKGQSQLQQIQSKTRSVADILASRRTVEENKNDTADTSAHDLLERGARTRVVVEENNRNKKGLIHDIAPRIIKVDKGWNARVKASELSKDDLVILSANDNQVNLNDKLHVFREKYNIFANEKTRQVNHEKLRSLLQNALNNIRINRQTGGSNEDNTNSILQLYVKLIETLTTSSTMYKLTSLNIKEIEQLLNDEKIQISTDKEIINKTDAMILLQNFLYIDITLFYKSSMREISSFYNNYVAKYDQMIQIDTANYSTILGGTDGAKFIFVKRFADIITDCLSSSDTIDNIVKEKLCNYIEDSQPQLKVFIELYKYIENSKRNSGFQKAVDNLLRERVKQSVLTYVKIRNDDSMYKDYNRRFNISYNTGDNEKSLLLVKYNDHNLPYYKYDETSGKWIGGDKSAQTQTWNNLYSNNNKDYDNYFGHSGSTLKVKKYDNEYVIGPVTRVFKHDMDNKQIANEMTDVIKSLLESKPVFIIGYGASGAGKTSSLIYFNKGNNENTKNGILMHICNRMGLEGFTNIKVKAMEFFVQKEKSNATVIKSPKGDKNSSIDFDYDNGTFRLKGDYTHKNTYHERVKLTNIASEYASTSTDNKTTKFLTGCPLGEVVIHLIDVDRYVKATTNNPNSSRSHTLVFIKFLQGSHTRHLIVGDFAGVENLFECEKPETIGKFLNIKRDGSQNRFYSEPDSIGGIIDIQGGDNPQSCEQFNEKDEDLFIFGTSKRLPQKTKDDELLSDIFEETNLYYYAQKMITDFVCKDDDIKDADSIEYLDKLGSKKVMQLFDKALPKLNELNKNIESISEVKNAIIALLDKGNKDFRAFYDTIMNNIFNVIVTYNAYYTKRETSRAKIPLSDYLDPKKCLFIAGYNTRYYDKSPCGPNAPSNAKSGYKVTDMDMTDGRAGTGVYVSKLTDNFTTCTLSSSTKWSIPNRYELSMASHAHLDTAHKINNTINQGEKQSIINELEKMMFSKFKKQPYTINPELYNKKLSLYSLGKYGALIDESITIEQLFNKIQQVFSHPVFAIMGISLERDNKEDWFYNIYTKFLEFYDKYGKKKLEVIISNMGSIITNVFNETRDIYIERSCRLKYGKDICEIRRNEGVFINNSLKQIRDVIKQILIEKNKNSINIAPVFLEPCLSSYCENQKCFKLDDAIQNSVTSDIFNNIVRELGYNTIDDLKDLVVGVFCVLNLSKKANNPPPVPFIDTTKVWFDVNNVTDLQALNKSSKFKVNLQDLINNVIRLKDKIGEVLKTDMFLRIIEILENNDDIDYSDKDQIISLLEMLDNISAASAIGTLQFVDILSKYNSTKIICSTNNMTEKEKNRFNIIKINGRFRDIVTGEPLEL